MSTPNAWYVRRARLENALWSVACYVSDAFDDGSVVDEPGELDGLPLLWKTEAIERGILRIDQSSFAAPSAPPVWFVSVPEPRADPAATNLVAFARDDFADGTVVSSYTFASLGLDNDEQAGAIRWYPKSGVVHQVYVAPAWRRRQLGTKLIYAASAFHQANGWPDRLHSDGRRTDIGEQFVAGLRHPGRIAPRDAVMPPMDPA